MAKRRGFPPVYKIERVAKMSAKSAFFGIFQKIIVVCCAMFFGFANAFSANLPAGYTELEYIESTGTQWIDTGLSENRTDYMELKFETVDDSSGFMFVNGSSQVGVKDARYGTTNPGTYVIKQNILTNKWNFINETNGTTYTNGSPGSARLYLFNLNNDGGGKYKNKNVKIYYYKASKNDNLVFNAIPVRRNSDGELGMYDTVSGTFFTNAGTGSFTAGPAKCRNLFDANTVVNINRYIAQSDGAPTVPSSSAGSWRYSDYIEVEPSTTYKISGIIFASAETAGMAWYNQSKGYITGMSSSAMNNVNGVITSPNNAKYLRFSWRATSNPNWADTLQLESGSTATAYVPYCATPIKIATTAYNAVRFNPVKTDLNSAVATIREIVTKTINQTAAIASLQADKQTRPEDACPAGKKCLLVETEENGVIVPHWFPIIEAPE